MELAHYKIPLKKPKTTRHTRGILIYYFHMVSLSESGETGIHARLRI